MNRIYLHTLGEPCEENYFVLKKSNLRGSANSDFTNLETFRIKKTVLTYTVENIEFMKKLCHEIRVVEEISMIT